MGPDLKALWELHLIDAHILELQKKLKKLDPGTNATSDRDSAKSVYDTLHQQLQQVEAEIRDIDLNRKSTETKRKEFDQKLYSGKVTIAKELQAIQDEISMLDRHKDKLETRELELLDQQATLKEQAAAAKSAYDEKQAALDVLLGFNKDEAHAIREEMKSLIPKRADAEKVISDQNFAMLRKYESLLGKIHSGVMAAVTGSKCSACGVSQPGQTLRDVKIGEEIIVCESCGRILVYVG